MFPEVPATVHESAGAALRDLGRITNQSRASISALLGQRITSASWNSTQALFGIGPNTGLLISAGSAGVEWQVGDRESLSVDTARDQLGPVVQLECVTDVPVLSEWNRESEILGTIGGEVIGYAPYPDWTFLTLNTGPVVMFRSMVDVDSRDLVLLWKRINTEA